MGERRRATVAVSAALCLCGLAGGHASAAHALALEQATTGAAATPAIASVSCGLGAFGPGAWPSACWRPYSDGSPFNRPIPANPRVVASSAAIVSRVVSMGRIADLVVAPDSPDDWYHPTYYSRPDDPVYTVHCVVYDCETEGMQVRIPADARPAGGEDGHMTVVDQTAGWEWDFWQVRSKPAHGGILEVSGGGRTQIAGDGLGSDANAGQWGLLAGIIRAQELVAGRIDHALFMVVRCTRRAYVYPAGGLASPCADQTNAPADGQHFQLDMTDAEIDALAVPAWKKTVLRALARYGAFVGDTGGRQAFGFQFESGSTSTSFGVEDPLVAVARAQSDDVVREGESWQFDLGRGVDWAHRLRVLDPCVATGTC